MTIGIFSVGLATAQGDVAKILSASKLQIPAALPWQSNRWTSCEVCRPALGMDSNISGMQRWQRLARMALEDCLGGQWVSPETPLIVASSNGGADVVEVEGWRDAFDTQSLLRDTPWAGQSLPVVSGSCASGLQALYLAEKLMANGHDKVVVLAADILSPASHDNFEALRVLSARPAPWQPVNDGFIPGEAAVALILSRDSGEAPQLSGPILRHDLGGNGGLSGVLAGLSLIAPELIIGLGSGPPETDELELNAIGKHFDGAVPVTTPLLHFGHTNGASGLLSVALGMLAQRTSGWFPSLSMNGKVASDGRPLSSGVAKADTVIVCRSLSGACAAAGVSKKSQPHASRQTEEKAWGTTEAAIPLMSRVLRQIAEAALQKRPAIPPDLLVVRLESPISPPPEAQIGGRLLPSAILEITPGFIPQLIARSWGYSGAAICLVGDGRADAAANRLLQACGDAGVMVCSVKIRGSGERRHVDWNT
ncbi:MAG: hypothetical protein JWR19_2006 [Pedosphaera sp.]|nr:hypothetical protein [Pedosphaera sp.]